MALLLIHKSLWAQQNLVPNPSFEDTISCPITLGDFSVVDWVSPTVGTPDYYHSCNNLDVSVPQNGVGWQYPRTGNAYIGFWTILNNSNNIREYIQCRLISPLEAGEQYEISFWASRADSCSVACNNIGAYLSSSPISSSTSSEALLYTPQVVTTSVITDADNWIQIMDTITAIGGEEYLTIGVFSSDANTQWIYVNGGWVDETIYYIDDVSVIHIPSFQIPNVITPNNDDINDFIDFSYFSGNNVFILNRWGNIVFSTENQSNYLWDGKDLLGNTLPDGVYFYTIELKDNKKTGFIHLVR